MQIPRFYIERWRRGDKPTVEDTSDFNNLLRQLALDYTLSKEKTIEDFRDFMGHLNHIFIVARRQETGRIVGMASLHIKSLFKDGLIGEVEEVVVDASCRGAGVADALDDALRMAAKEFGVCMIRLTSNPLRIGANKFYTRRGYIRYDTNNYRLVLD